MYRVDHKTKIITKAAAPGGALSHSLCRTHSNLTKDNFNNKLFVFLIASLQSLVDQMCITSEIIQEQYLKQKSFSGVVTVK